MKSWFSKILSGRKQPVQPPAEAFVTQAAESPSNSAQDIGATIVASNLVDPHAIHAAERQVAAEWRVGDVILDLYEVKEIHEGGGMGLVYRVHHRGWNMELAVKSPRAEYFHTEAQKDDFSRECETWINLGLHPHIVSCHYVRVLGGIPRVFAEYVEGGSLKDWIDSRKLYEGGPQESLRRILDIAIQMAWGLHYAHEIGVIHQDVKPANVMMMPDGTVKITDFGLARARAAAGESIVAGGARRSILVSSGGMTPAYCSPEQANGKPVSHKTDIWSWAVSVLEMFVGEVCWQSGTVAPEVLMRIDEVRAEGVPLPDMPEYLRKSLLNCLNTNPANRATTLSACIASLYDIHMANVGAQYPRLEPKTAGDSPDELSNRALSLLDLHKSDEAECLFERTLELDRNHIAATYNLGLLRWRCGRYLGEELLLRLQEIKKDHPNDAELECALAWVRFEGGDYNEALEHFAKAKGLGGESKPENGQQQAQLLLKGGVGQCRHVLKGHSESVDSAAFSPDGRLLLSASCDKTLRLWDITTGNCLRVFEGLEYGSPCVCFSPDGRFALTGASSHSLTNNLLRLWDVVSGKCVRTFQGPWRDINCVAFAPNGRFALMGADRNALYLLDMANSQALSLLCAPTDGMPYVVITSDGGVAKSSNWSVRSVAVSPDSSYALFGSDDGMLRLLDVASRHCLRTMEVGEERSSCSFSPDGRLAISGGHDGFLRLWNLADGQCLRVFKGYPTSVSSVAYSPRGRFILSGCSTLRGKQPDALRLWDVVTGQCLRVFQGPESVYSLAFSPDGRLFVSGGEGEIRLWEVASFVEHRNGARWLFSKIVTSEGALKRQLAYDSHLSKARDGLSEGLIADTLEFIKRARIVPGFEGSPECRNLKALAGSHACRTSCGGAWLEHVFTGHAKDVTTVALSPDGAFVLSGSLDKTIRMWDMSTRECLRIFEGHTNSVRSVAVSPDGQFLLSGGDDETLRLWTLAGEQSVHTLTRVGKFESVKSVAFSPDGRLALYVANNECHMLQLSSRQDMHFSTPERRIRDATFSPDGRFLLTGSFDNELDLWSVATGRCLRSMTGHMDMINSVAFSPDGRLALSGSGCDYDGSDDLTVRLWDLNTGKCLRVLEGHTSDVKSVAFSPDGRFALSGSGDMTVRLWNLATGHCLRVFEGHTIMVNSVAFSPGGRYALSASGYVYKGSKDNTIRLWEIDWDYEFSSWADWDDGAACYLHHFLTLHSPVSIHDSTKIEQPAWTEVDFRKLIINLGNRGYGWLRPEGVRRQLEKMRAEWQGPPLMPWE